jgi:hypothetical protein
MSAASAQLLWLAGLALLVAWWARQWRRARADEPAPVPRGEALALAALIAGLAAGGAAPGAAWSPRRGWRWPPAPTVTRRRERGCSCATCSSSSGRI